MYSRAMPLVQGLGLRATTRRYATRRIIKQTPQPPLISPSRQFQSIGHQLSQPATLGESPPMFDQILESGVNEGQRPPTDVHTNSAYSQNLAVEEKDPSGCSIDEGTIKVESPLYFRGQKFDREPYWQKIPRWKDVSENDFLTYSWQIAKDIQGSMKLYKFLDEVLPGTIPYMEGYEHIRTKEEFIADVVLGIKEAPMSIRLTPQILSLIDWNNPMRDPLRRQFIPMKSMQLPDHPELGLDSLHEVDDSPVQGLVHRYPDKVLFLATSVCGHYCRYCTRSYAVGGNTETVRKIPNRPVKSRWDDALAYIRSNPKINDVVLSGGDSYYLPPEHLRYIGDALLEIPHIRRFRVATKGLCVSPSRTLDAGDTWTDELVRLSERGRERGVQVALHTHFNHPNEVSWVTREAAQVLFRRGVVVRNQSVLLKGVNDDVETMGELIRELADMNFQPYYVYQCDMVAGIEDLRTPLSTILDIERTLRGSIAGFMMPSFVVDLPGGGGKRLAASYDTYNRSTGRSTFVAPAVTGEAGRRSEKRGKIYEYWDPVASTEGAGADGVDADGAMGR